MKQNLAILFWATTLLDAQPRPQISPRRILTQAEENYCTCAMPSLDAEANVQVEKSSPLERSSLTFQITTHFLPADKFRIQRKSANWMIELNNGKEMAQFAAGNYTFRHKSPQRWSEGIRPDDFPGSHWLIYDGLTAGARNIRLKGEETLTVEGKPVPCYIIEYDRDIQYRNGVITGKTTVWIGKQEKYVYKEISSRPPMPPGDPADGRIDKLPSHRTVVITKLNLTTPPNAVLFDPDATARNLPKEEEPAGLTTGPIPPPPPAANASQARKILAEVATHYNTIDTYRARHISVYDERTPQGQRLIRMPMDVAYRRPGKWRIAFEQTGDIWIQDRSQPDGYWQWWPKRNLYWRSIHTQFLRGAELLYEDLADNLLSAKLLLSETIQADGRAIRCTVIEATYQHSLNLLQHETLLTLHGQYKFWIDPTRKLVLQWRTGNVTETLLKLELNPPIPNTGFTFHPPAGATLYRPF